jgi:hypothetical protein
VVQIYGIFFYSTIFFKNGAAGTEKPPPNACRSRPKPNKKNKKIKKIKKYPYIYTVFS